MSQPKVLLLTDVVDSTQLSENLGDEAMLEVWEAHDRVARDLLPRWHGREIDKTDGMLLMFDTVIDGVEYARAYQRALSALPVPLAARAGLHRGAVVLRENRPEDIARGAKPLEVDGLAKPMAARVMALAHGGQLLLSAAAASELAGADLALQSHGHWMLKGLTDPVEILEVTEGEAAGAPPEDGEKAYRVVRSGHRWLPVREIPNNLPQQMTTFVGRARELRELKTHLRRVRLLTLLGMGGLGKTRLSLQTAAETRHLYPDGVWFIDLSPIRDPALVASQAAQVVGVRDVPDSPLIQSLCTYLKTRRVLLILDNCEHLTQAAAELAHALLQAAPELRILASSRETLRVPGELGYVVQPLPVPERDASLPNVLQAPAVRLFVERAQSHKPTFSLAADEAAAVAELVARLEGIPLAIELAAARVRSLGVRDINLRLRDRYKVLTGGSRTLQARQQTLRALVDWSYDLLVPAEQTMLARLSVFVGGFDLAAAEQVCGVDPLDGIDVVDLLASLVEKSMAMTEERGRGTRYRMLETIREYALEKLDIAGDRAATARRHCDHYFALAKQAREGLAGADQALWIERLETDLDNVRSATALAIDGGTDAFIAVKMAVALQGFWILRGYGSEGRAVIGAALALPAVRASDVARAHALYVGAALASSQGDYVQARQMLQTCLDLRRRLDEPVAVAATLSTLSLARLHDGDIGGALGSEREALRIFRSVGDRVGEAIGLQHLGLCWMAQGDRRQARAELAQALLIARDISHRELEAECEQMLGEIELDEGGLDRARAHFNRSLDISCGAADKRSEAIAQRWLGKVDLAEGDVKAAHARLADALQTFRSFEMREEVLGCLEDHARLAQASGRLEDAARLATAVQTLRSRLALALLPQELARWQAWFASLCASVPAATLASAALVGRSWEIEEAVRQATMAAATEPG